MANPVTASVPTSRARIPYCGWTPGSWPPVGAGEKLDQVQLAEEHRRRFAEHEEENGEDEEDRDSSRKAG